MKIIKGNIFKSDCQTIVNTVNCYGIMGAGIALECKYRYPDMFLRYEELCKKKLMEIGKLYLYKSNDKWILNFPTKNHWKYESKPEYLEKGLEKFIETYKEKNIDSIAFPLLGASHGGLTTEQSLNIMTKHLSKIDIKIEIYHFDPKASDDLIDSFTIALKSQDKDLTAKLIGIKREKLFDIIEAINKKKINRMMDISKIKGIGETTMKKCFAYAIGEDCRNIQLNLF